MAEQLHSQKLAWQRVWRWGLNVTCMAGTRLVRDNHHANHRSSHQKKSNGFFGTEQLSLMFYSVIKSVQGLQSGPQPFVLSLLTGVSMSHCAAAAAAIAVAASAIHPVVASHLVLALGCIINSLCGCKRLFEQNICELQIPILLQALWRQPNLVRTRKS